MSQFGMQMPGGRARRGSSPDVYTGLLFLSVAALVAACLVVYFAGARIGPEGNALGMHIDGQPVKLATPGQ